jgi:hypothetical protein
MSYSGRIAGVCVAAAVLAGCSNWALGPSSPSSDFDHRDVIERSTMQFGQPPLKAGECIAANAQAQGTSAQLLPLYGWQSVAVTVKESAVGDIIAVFTLTDGPRGTTAQTTTWAGVQDRQALLNKLAQGC